MTRFLYGICTDSSRKFTFVPAIFRIGALAAFPTEWKKPNNQRALWWARQGLNLRPHPCEGRDRSGLARGDRSVFPCTGKGLVREMYEAAVRVRSALLLAGLAGALSGCTHAQPSPCWDLLLTGSGTVVFNGNGECGRPAEDEVTKDPVELERADEVVR